MSLRVCLVTPEFPPYRFGGIGCYVDELAQGLARRGHTVTVVGWRLNAPAAASHEWGRLVSLDWEWPGLWRIDAVADPLGTWRAAIALRRYIREHAGQFDVIEAPNWRGDAVLFERGGAPLVVRVSTPWRDCLAGPPALGDRGVFLAERRSTRGASLVIAHSMAMARKAERNYGVTRCLVIPLGISAGPDPRPERDDTIDFVCIGRAERRKGTDLLLPVLRDVMTADARIRATFIGANLTKFVSSRPDLFAVLQDLRVACPGRFIEIDRADESTKWRALVNADWLLMPSRFESFGLVAVEAMRAGTPGILSKAGGLEEIGSVAPGTIFIEPGSEADLRSAVRRAIDLGARYRASIEQAIRAAFLERFTADRFVAATEDAYYRLLNRTPADRQSGAS